MPFQPGTQFSVSAVSTFPETPSDVSVASNGDFVTVWEDSDTIYVRRFGANGVAKDIANIEVTTGAEKPKVSVAADGSFVVVFEKGDGAFFQRRALLPQRWD